MVIKSCVICGVEFDATANGKACGAACRKENINAKARQWRSDHPEQRERDRNRKHTEEYRSQSRKRKRWRYANDREYREASLIRVSEHWYNNPQYRQQRRDKERQRIREDTAYREKHRIRKRIDVEKRMTRANSIPCTLTQEQWQHAIDYFNGCCAICGRQTNDMFGEFTSAMDHWIPFSYEGDDNPGTVSTNIIPLCHGIDGCNNRKGSTMPDEWLVRQYGKRKATKISKRIQEYFDSLEKRS